MEGVCRRYGVTLRRAALVEEGSKVLPDQLVEELAALTLPPDEWLR